MPLQALNSPHTFILSNLDTLALDTPLFCLVGVSIKSQAMQCVGRE